MDREPAILSPKTRSIRGGDTAWSILSVTGAVVTSSAMLYWGTGLHPLWWLTWFAPLPVLLI
jgi:hypothetical protein